MATIVDGPGDAGGVRSSRPRPRRRAFAGLAVAFLAAAGVTVAPRADSRPTTVVDRAGPQLAYPRQAAPLEVAAGNGALASAPSPDECELVSGISPDP